MIDQVTFSKQVRDAFWHLHDLPKLRTHPLGKLLGRRGGALSGEELRRVLLRAIEQLKPPDDAPPHSAVYRRYRYLRLRYLEGASHESIARDLVISTRQARRDHLDALDAVSSVLWEASEASREAALVARPEADAGDQPGARAEDRHATLDAELAKARLQEPGGLADLRELVAGVGAIAGKMAERLGGTVETSLPDTLPPASGDRTILRQILLSVLGYAVEVAGGAHLTITAAERGDDVVLCAVVASTGQSPSSGTGLAPSAETASLLEAGEHLSRLHGVQISFRRVGDRPLTVEVAIPVARPVTVLVVDDNPDMVRLFERFLRGTTYRIVHAKTWQRALRLGQEAKPDVITLDVMMPSLDGWDIFRRLRELPETRETPVIVCSVLPQRSVALAMGAAGFLSKPVTRESLLAALEGSRRLGETGRPDCS